MIIPEDILKSNNAVFVSYKKNDYIFYEDDLPEFYYQIIRGTVKMSSYSQDGQEFIQGILKDGESFGEAAIFGNFPYPNNAIAMEDSELAKIPVPMFLNILSENFDIHRKFNYIMAERLRYKAIVLKEISSYQPDHILYTLLNYLRNSSPGKKEGKFLVPYTRQQLADMTGLRVETVIRTIKKLSLEGKLEISEHKIYLK